MHKPHIRIPATLQDCLQGIYLAHSYFQPGGIKGFARRVQGKEISLIRREVMVAAFEKNPFSALVVTDHEGNVVGFYEAWPINDQKLDALLSGLIKDEELEADDFLSLDKPFNKLYITMTVPLTRADGHRISEEFARECLLALMYAATRLFDCVYLHREGAYGKLQQFALSETVDGRNLAEDLGHQIDARSFKRRDGKLVYYREVTKAWVDQVRIDYRLRPDRFVITEAWPKAMACNSYRSRSGRRSAQ